MDLSSRIKSAERDLKKNLEDFFSFVFGSTILASHGLDHHRRVWNYAKGFILIPEIARSLKDEAFPPKLLIASYLHDLGMSVDPGPKHGAVSSRFCEEFLNNYKLPLNEYIDVREAIANHDNKDYSSHHEISKLLSILSVADDLDAFGYIGIYRYLEIYMTRKIPFEQLGLRIGENVKGRFENLLKNYGFLKPFADEQRLRYEKINSFFIDFNSQLQSGRYRPGVNKPSGNCGVAELVETAIEKKMTLHDLLALASLYDSDEYINLFFSGLKRELSGN
jgi:HD superfamily phosphodiesterase